MQGDKQSRKFVNITRPKLSKKRLKKAICSPVLENQDNQLQDEGSSIERAGCKSFNVWDTSAHQSTSCSGMLQFSQDSFRPVIESSLDRSFISTGPPMTFPVAMKPYMYKLIHYCKSILQIKHDHHVHHTNL
jgi:hypothetical protein